MLSNGAAASLRLDGQGQISRSRSACNARMRVQRRQPRAAASSAGRPRVRPPVRHPCNEEVGVASARTFLSAGSSCVPEALAPVTARAALRVLFACARVGGGVGFTTVSEHGGMLLWWREHAGVCEKRSPRPLVSSFRRRSTLWTRARSGGSNRGSMSTRLPPPRAPRSTAAPAPAATATAAAPAAVAVPLPCGAVRRAADADAAARPRVRLRLRCQQQVAPGRENFRGRAYGASAVQLSVWTRARPGGRPLTYLDGRPAGLRR